MRYHYDCEFLEDGRTLQLISIGIVAADGRELYLVNYDAPWKKIKKHGWLMTNVVPGLPQPPDDAPGLPRGWLFDMHDPAVRRKSEIAYRVKQFLLEDGDPYGHERELWASYGAYDHVALCQLFGAMISLPPGIPMFTHDLQQERRRRGNPLLPRQAAGLHNALEDARHVKACLDSLDAEDT